MYAAKADGRRTHRFFEPEMDARVKKRQQLEQDLRQSVVSRRFAASGFEGHYQPLVNLQTNSVSGCEASLRWKHARTRHDLAGGVHPGRRRHRPDQSSRRMGTGCRMSGGRQLARYCQARDQRLAGTVSQPDAGPARVGRAGGRLAFKTGRLELEITEAVLIRDDDGALATLQQLRAMGVRTALELISAPAIGARATCNASRSIRSRSIAASSRTSRSSDGSASIVQAVVSIASTRSMTTTAEGVETESQREALRLLGCTEI